MTESEHVPGRPSWDCRCCGKPWPCDPARESLKTEMNRVELAIYMWVNLDDACEDLPKGKDAHERHVIVIELFHRFIKWTH